MANIGSDALGLQTQSALYEKVLQSRTIQDHLIDRFDLRKVYRTALYSNARLRLNDNTEINDDRKSGVITITVRAPSPQMAAAMAKSYVDELNTVMMQLDTSSAHRERVFLESRLKEVEADIDRDATRLGAFSSKNTTLDLTEQGKAMMTGEELLRGQAIAAESDLEALRQIYGPENERVLAAHARSDELQRQLETMRGSSGADAGEVNGYPSIRKLPLLGVEYADLDRNLRVQEVVFETLTKEYETAKVDEAKDLPTVRVLDEADVAERKSQPKRTLIVAMGVCLAFLFSCVYILGENWWSGVDDDGALKNFARELRTGMAADLSRVPGLRRFGSTSSKRGAGASDGGENG